MRESKFLSLRVRPLGLLLSGVLIAGLLTLCGSFGRYSWLLELTTHFRLQYLFFLLPATVFLIYWKAVWQATICGALAILNLIPVAALFLPAKSPLPSTHPASPPLKVLLLNVHTSNTHHDSVTELIQEEDPDIVVLEEVDSIWDEALSSLSAKFPHKLVQTRDDNFGILLMSKFPMQSSKILTLDESHVPSILAAYSISGMNFTILATHPLPPSGKRNLVIRNEHLGKLANLVSELDGPTLLLGDLNTTPWSPYFHDLLKHTGLRNSSQGRGPFPSWPATLWPPLRIPIDHCLYTGDLEILEKHLGKSVYSDHLPVVIRFHLCKKPS